jgi:energy-coupling factor transport system ATP-binding protein
MHIERGHYVAVTGPNGSGKSTLVKAICGLAPRESGSVSIDGREVIPGRFGDDLFGSVAVVFQEPGGQFLMPDVESEIGAVIQNLGLPSDLRKEKAGEIFERFSLKGILKEQPENLSGGRIQLVNLACAMAMSPSILLLDEPTTFLDLRYRKMILDTLDDLSAVGLTIMHVTQYPEEALRSGRLVVLRDGELAADGDPETILADEKISNSFRLAVPRSLAFVEKFGFDLSDTKAIDSFVSEINERGTGVPREKGEIPSDSPAVLEADNIRFSYGESSFTLRLDRFVLAGGSIVGVVGPAGSGKSTLAFILAGLLEPNEGEISLRGKTLKRYERNTLRRKIGMSWQLPERTFVGPAVKDDLSSIMDNLDIQSIDIGKRLVDIGLGGFEDRIVDSLSGGEKRKLSLAAAMLANPDCLILDEPAAFLDPYAQKEIGDILKKLAESGTGLLVISHDLPFLAEIADRVIGLHSGRIAFDTPAPDFFNDPSYQRLVDFPPEPMVDFRHRLVKRGVKLRTASMDPGALFSEILTGNSG